MVRRATADDRAAILRLLKEAHGAAALPFAFSAPHISLMLDAHMSDGLVLVTGKPARGVLMAMTFDHPFGAGKWAKETVWYIAPSARGRAALPMLDAYEAWAREQGCTTIGMASLATNDVSRIYERRGYAPVETHFVKSLR